jgi:hypothetical protein
MGKFINNNQHGELPENGLHQGNNANHWYKLQLQTMGFVGVHFCSDKPV